MEDEDEVRIIGTPLWSPPEHTGENITIRRAKKMDVYSFGLVCCWILFFDTISVDREATVESGKLPTAGHSRKNAYGFLERLKTLESPEETVTEIVSDDPTFTGHQSSLLQKFLMQALCKSPSNRPHDWFDFMLLIRELQGLG